MDENNIAVTEEFEDTFDGWEEEVETFDTEEDEDTEPETDEEDEDEEEAAEPEESEEVEEAEADQPEEEDKADETDAKEPEKEDEKQPETPPAPESFKLKHLGEEKEYSREDVITYAQKGLDYDRIRAERDSLRAEAPKHRDHEAFLNEIAQSAGITVDKMIEDIRTRQLVDRESKAGRPLTETAAREQIQREMAARAKENAKPEGEQTEAEAAEKSVKDERDARKRAEIQKFAIAHPDVKGQDIPTDVWQAFHDTESSLEELYTSKVLYPKVLKELEELKTKAAAKEQSDKNAARSTGSRKSAGKTKAAKDPFYDGWDD